MARAHLQWMLLIAVAAAAWSASHGPAPVNESVATAPALAGQLLLSSPDGYGHMPGPNRADLNEDMRSNDTQYSQLPAEHPVQLRILCCGPKGAERFAKALFPERAQGRWPSNLVPTSSDILLVGKHCPGAESFPGKVLYFDGENGRMFITPNNQTFYVGLPNPPRPVRGHLQLFHVARTTFFHPYSAKDFLRPRRMDPSPNFLIYINSHCVGFREQAFDAIARMAKERGIQPPTAAGKCHGSSPEYSQHMDDSKDRIKNVVGKMSAFRFALVMENSNVAGYVTEKIANAFMGSTVPIDYGTRDIFKLCNKDAFIYYDVQRPGPALNRIAELEANRTAYMEVLAQPILADGERTLEEYFSLSDDVGGGRLKRRIRAMVLGHDAGR